MIRTALYTGHDHQPDPLCESGACFTKCTKSIKTSIGNEVIFYPYNASFLKKSVREYRKGLRVKNYRKFMKHIEKHETSIEYLAGVCDSENLGSKNLIHVYRAAVKQKNLYLRNTLIVRLAQHNHAGRVLLTVLAKEGTDKVKTLVASRTDIPEKAQFILAFEGSEEVREKLKNNPSVQEKYRVIASLY